MVTDQTCLTRGSIEEIAGSLQQLVQAAPDGRQRRQLAECAARLQAVARTIHDSPILSLSRSTPVLDAARRVADSMGQVQRSTVLLLGLLLAKPGQTHASRDLAPAIGISPQSVRVFAFHLRKWLGEQGHPQALRSQWGIGYMLLPLPAAALLQADPLLAQLVQAIRHLEPRVSEKAA